MLPPMTVNFRRRLPLPVLQDYVNDIIMMTFQYINMIRDEGPQVRANKAIENMWSFRQILNLCLLERLLCVGLPPMAINLVDETGMFGEFVEAV